MSDDPTTGDKARILSATDLLALDAALTAERDQRESELGRLFGLDRGLPENVVFVVAPDVGQRLTRDGVIPSRLRINWNLEPGTVIAMDPALPDFTG